MTKVSVLMPVHNGAPFIRAAVDSILSQTMTDFELVVVNDGSSDSTGTLLDTFADRDSRIRAIHLPSNLGIVCALNVGLESCAGQYIARMDGDDLARADRLATQMAFLDEHPDHVACGSDVLLFGAEYWYARFPRTSVECRSYLTLFPCFAHGAVMLRRNAMMDLRYEEGYQFAEDYRLWTRLALLGKLANIPRPLLRYRVHAKQSSITAQETQRVSHCRIAAEVLAGKSLSGIDAASIQRFLWPGSSDHKQKRLDYARYAYRFICRLWGMNDGHCRWLRTRMLRVAVRNTLLFK